MLLIRGLTNINRPLDPKFQKPTQLGADAIWDKVRYIHSNRTFGRTNGKLTNQKRGPAATDLQIGNNRIISNSEFKNNGCLVKFGFNGEVFIASESSIQVWDWIRSSLEIRELETRYQQDTKADDSYEPIDSNPPRLHLVSSLNDVITIPKERIIDFIPIDCNQDRNCYKVLLITQSSEDRETSLIFHKFGQFFPDDHEFTDCNKSLILPPITHGGFPYAIKASGRFIGISTDEGCLTIFDQIKKRPLTLDINVAIRNGHALFDIVGRSLVYVPSAHAKDDASSTSLNLTKLNISENRGSFYTRFFDGLESTAIDSLMKLTAVENFKTANVRQYLTGLLNTSFHMATSEEGNSNFKPQKVEIVDLETGQRLGQFVPLNGISNISLCPYNPSNLITISKRGDMVYKWDLTRMPCDIALSDVQIRGKTGSIVKQITWSSIDSFQILTESSGSIHNFSVLDSKENWILPNLQTNLISSMVSKQGTFLMVLTNDTLSAVDQKSGTLKLQFKLPGSLIPKSLLPDYIPRKPKDEIIVREPSSVGFISHQSRLSCIEVESFLKLPSLRWETRTTQKFALHAYKIITNDKERGSMFWDSYRIPTRKVKFNAIGQNNIDDQNVQNVLQRSDHNVEVVSLTDITGALANALDSVIIHGRK